MTISELIAKLEAMKAERGDLPVMTPGFDETGRSPVENVVVERLYLRFEPHHSGAYDNVERVPEWEHEELAEAEAKAFDAVVINF